MTLRRYVLVVIALGTALLCGFFTKVHAQTIGINAGDINLELSPETPGPNETVTATLVSYVTNLNNQQITWFVNRQLVKTEVGAISLTFTTGNQGTTTQVEAQILVDGQNISKIIQISPTAVDLLWEADTYVPPFYKGKKLATRQSTVTITAIPQFKIPTIDSIRTAVYYWQRDFTPLTAASGYAKQALRFENNPIKTTENLGITVKNRTETEVAANTLDIPFRNPFIVFYEKQGSRIFERRGSLAGFRVTTDTFNLVAVPYYFAFDKLSDINFNWLADGRTLTVNNTNQSEILFELPQKGRQTNISLSITSTPKLLQTASRNLQLIY